MSLRQRGGLVVFLCSATPTANQAHLVRPLSFDGCRERGVITPSES